MRSNSDVDKKHQSTKQFQEFIFVGGNQLNGALDSAETKEKNLFALDSGNILLSNLKAKQRVMIAQIYTDRSTYNYLYQLGLRLGVIVEIISKTATNSVVIAINGKQSGLGAEITQKVVVNFIK